MTLTVSSRLAFAAVLSAGLSLPAAGAPLVAQPDTSPDD